MIDLRPEHEAAYFDVRDGDTLNHLLDLLSGSDPICFDLETMSDREPNEDWHPHSRIVSAAFTVEAGEAWVVPLSHPAAPWSDEWRKIARHLFLACKQGRARLIGHNLKYDVRWARSMTGVDLNPWAWFDTMDAMHLLEENLPKGLKVMAETLLDAPPWADVDLGRSEQEPWPELAKYNALDTIYTWALHDPLKRALAKQPSLARLYKHLMRPVSRALCDIERVGMQLDVEALRLRYHGLHRQIKVLEEKMWEEHVPPEVAEEYSDATVRVWKDDDGSLHVSAPGLMPTWSPQGNFFNALMQALNVPVIEETEKGKPSWAEGVMKKLTLRGDYPFVADHLEWRHMKKELDSFVRPWLDMMSEDGRLYPTFKPAHVSTGRLSAADPNPQQIPSKLKPVFVAPEGWNVCQVDYAQIELRIAAEIAPEPAMLEAFRQRKDLHTLMAAQIAGVSEKKVTEDQRSHAKPVNFGFLYGMGAENFTDYAFKQYGVLFTYTEAVRVRNLFFDTWRGLEAYYDRTVRSAESNGYVKSRIGRRRNLPDIHSRRPYYKSMAERQAINALIQGLASDLMLLAIIELHERLDPERARIFCTVHDSLVLYVRKGHARYMVDTVAEAMLHPTLERFRCPPLTVPLEVKFEIGPAWGQPVLTVVRSTV
jgi:DNA polymerase I